MRRLFTAMLAISLFGFVSPAFAGEWELVFQNPGGAIISMEAPDETHLFAFGTKPDPADPQNALPAGYKTTGVDTYGEFALPATGDMFFPSSTQCTAPDRCYMLAMDINSATMAMAYPFMLSTNGGDSWTKFAGKFYRGNPPTIAAYGANLAMFFGGDTLIQMTYDGGVNSKSWIVPKAGDVSYMSIAAGHILDGNNAWLANGKVTESQDGKTRTIEPVGAIIKTSDFQTQDGTRPDGSPKPAMTWEEKTSGQAWYPRKLQFVTKTVGYMITETADGYQLRKTTDGGSNWTEIVFPEVGEFGPVQWVNDFWAFDEDDLIVVAATPNGDEDSWGIIYRITAGGNPVAMLPDPTEHADAMYAVRCPTRNLCFAAGDNADIIRFVDDTPIEPEVDADTGSADVIDRDLTGEGDEGGVVLTDATGGKDLAGWQPDDSGCSAGSSAKSGWFVLLLLVIGCAAVFGIRRVRA